MNLTPEERCCKQLLSGYDVSRCFRRGVVERDGERYCKQHDPVAVEARADARQAQWDAKRKAQQETAARAAQRTALLEEVRIRFFDVANWPDYTGSRADGGRILAYREEARNLRRRWDALHAEEAKAP